MQSVGKTSKGNCTEQERKIFRTSHGNTLTIEFEYPEDNPQNYMEDITTALNYAGVFKGISREDANLL